MPLSATRLKRRPPTWRDYWSGQIILWGLVFIGPAFIFYGYYADQRDRPSLQWPKVSGVVMRCDQMYHSGRHAYYNIAANYTYVINDRRYVGNQITLWNRDLHGGGGRTSAFVAAHPVRSAVDVYYDPLHPENAVLIPGPDEAGNHLDIQCGGVALVGGWFMAVMFRRRLADLKATLQSAEARAHERGPTKAAGLPQGFASYEPGDKRKLNVFPDKECLMEVLGHKGAPLQEWKPEDRVIDATGCEYRLVKEPGKKSYDLDPTGETWSYERLLDAAEADARLLKKDPGTLRRRLDDVAAEDRMAVLMKCIDDQPVGPRWVMAGLFLFLALFFLAVMFGAGAIFVWLQNHLFQK